MKTVFAAILGLALTASAASAGDYMSADEVKALFTGKTFDGVYLPKDKNFKAYEAPDGSHIVVERSLGSLEVPGGHQDDALGHRRRNPARWGSVELSEESGRGVVVPAMEVSDQSHDLGSTGDRPRQPQRQLRRFGPRVGEPHAFRAGYQALDPLRPF